MTRSRSIPSRVLICQTTYLGDLILTFPLVLALAEEFKGIQIDLVVRPELASLAEACPGVHCVHTFAKQGGHPTVSGIFALARLLRGEKYDTSIVLPGSIRTAIAVRLAGIPRRIGWNPGHLMSDQWRRVRQPLSMLALNSMAGILSFEYLYRASRMVRWMLPDLYSEELQPHRSSHRALEALDAVRVLGGRAEELPRVPWIDIPEGVSRRVSERLADRGGDWIVVAPGATQPTRRWPDEYWIRLVRLLANRNHRVLILGSELERRVAAGIAAAVADHLVCSVAGDLSVLESLDVIRRARVAIANDSAVVHMASAMGRPTIALFGPTLPSFGFGPLAARSVVMEREGLTCRPCTVYGSARCPVGTHECMRSLSPESVYNEVIRLTEGTGTAQTALRGETA
jgi:heptosyltransferase II